MAQRRNAGEGSLFANKDRPGWTGFLDLGRDATGKRRRRKFSGKTKAAVLDKLRAARAELDSGLPSASARDTVESLLRDFVARGLPPSVKSEGARYGYSWATDHHIVPALGARKLRDLSVDDVDTFLQGKAGDGLSKSSLRQVHGVLTRALRWGMKRGRVARNVSELVDTPDGATKQNRAMTVEQATALVTAVRGDRLEALFLLGLNVPSRPGELAGLAWSNVDLDTGVVHFRQALHRAVDGKTLYLGALKTEQSRRSVEVDPFVISALKRRKRVQLAERMRAPVWRSPDAPGDLDGELVFTTEIGTPIDPANLRRTFRGLAKRAGIPGTWTVYELRHTAVSIMSAEGVSIEVIADAAGHRSSRTTSVVYRHSIAPVVTATGSSRLFRPERG